MYSNEIKMLRAKKSIQIIDQCIDQFIGQFIGSCE